MLKFIVALTLSCLSAQAVQAFVVAVKAGKLIDPKSGQVLSNQTILVEDAKVSAIGSQLPIPKNAKVIDLSHQTVLPGLIDCHTHLMDETEIDPVVELRTTAAEKAYAAIPHAKRTLEAGFTSVRDVGTYRALLDVALRDAIARGDVVGPRMFCAGAYVTISQGGGALTGFAPDVVIPADFQFGKADGPIEVRKRVRELASRGVDLIKIIATGAVLTHGSNPGAEEFTFEEMKAAVDEAQKFGLKVAAHAHGTQGIKDAIRAGVASIEHGTFLDDEAIAMMKERGTYLVADIYDDDFIIGDGKLRGMPKDFLEHEAAVGKTQRENFVKAAKAGVKMSFGTDAGVFPHGQNARQFAYMVKFGLTPMQAIQSATTGAAALIGKPEEIGHLAPGMKADLIAVTGDPMQDISVLEKVDFVMKDGTVFKNR